MKATATKKALGGAKAHGASAGVKGAKGAEGGGGGGWSGWSGGGGGSGGSAERDSWLGCFCAASFSGGGADWIFPRAADGA